MPTPHPPDPTLHKVFDVDADDDIVVGDTIIFTERLYVDRDGNLIPGLRTGRPIQCPLPSSPHAFPVAVSGAAGSTPRISLSMASLESDTGGGKWAAGMAPTGYGRPATTTAASGEEFVGERTAAAHVLQDSFRSMKKKADGGVLEYNRCGRGCHRRRWVFSCIMLCGRSEITVGHTWCDSCVPCRFVL